MARAAVDGPRMSPREIAGWVFLVGLSALLLAVAGVVFLVGLPYYVSSNALRPEHVLHGWYRSGGVVGLLLGMIGVGLMTIMLLYSVRKWLTFLSFMGSNKFWMRFHMVCGLLGPLFILLHGGMHLPQGFVAIGFWCMILVSVSGFFGRYLFGYFPAVTGELKLDLEQAQKRLTELRAQLVADTQGAKAAQIAEAVRLARDLDFEPRSLGELTVLDGDVRRRIDLIRIMLYRSGMEPVARKRAEKTLVEQLLLRRSMAGFDVARRLLRYWSLFHQPLAVAMYLIVAVHIVNAVVFGGAVTTLLGGFF